MATIFTSLDLQSGDWQVELTEASRPLTAFTVGPLGFYECVWMPFGLTNAPATFPMSDGVMLRGNASQMVYNLFGWHHCFFFFFQKTPEEHIKRLGGVFEKFSAAGLRLNPSKCKFFKS